MFSSKRRRGATMGSLGTDTINAKSGIGLEEYRLVDRRGRFVLLTTRESGTKHATSLRTCGHQRRVRVTVKKAAQKAGKRRLATRSVENRTR
jgi:hypothetical protein